MNAMGGLRTLNDERLFFFYDCGMNLPRHTNEVFRERDGKGQSSFHLDTRLDPDSADARNGMSRDGEGVAQEFDRSIDA